MSGIVAARGPFDPRLGRRMLARLAHRGPDGEGERAVDGAWLGHRRLAIVDLEGGGQPLSSARGDLWLVGDGEIYNHRRLRARLGEERFRTGSDHEAALHLYDDVGVDAFDHLWGTFALVIAGEDGRFVAARDTLGVAPLYWARRDDTVLFASELKAFDEEWRALAEPFPTGTAWTPDGDLHPWRPEPVATPVLMRSRRPDEEPPAWVLDAVRETLIRAVERLVAADVPVGAFLSGGLDSSIVTAIAARIADREGWTLKTFAAGLPGSPDLRAARRIVTHLGTEHRERVYTVEEAVERVPEVIEMIESFDPSLVHSSVPNHLVAALARRHVKAVLIGEGADELFAGYSHYREISSGEELHQELLSTIRGLHNLGLQRVDRVTSANGLEARIPFLDLDVVELALALPPAWKLTGRGRPEKWLLRRAFEGWLPDEVLWRRKEQFGEGTGMNTALAERFTALVAEDELARERDVTSPPLRTREELAYYRIFARRLPGVRATGTIGRFVEA
jgi:asparagine synthase (glutamine-hydrolysing)